MIEIKNSVFDVQGASNKDTVYGITLSGNDNVIIENCKFANKGYSSILNNCEGDVIVKHCEFNCGNVYNPIEGSQKVSNGNMLIEDCTFKAAPGNNYINFYQFKDGSSNTIQNCTFEPTVDNNLLRISNRKSNKAQFVVKDCSYSYPAGSIPTDYTKFLLCQDYTNKSGVKQDFTNCEVIFDNVICDNSVLTKESSNLYYVWEDGKGIITGQGNDPIIIVK